MSIAQESTVHIPVTPRGRTWRLRHFHRSSIQPFGPIVAKELRVAARRPRTYWIRSIYIALLSMVAFFVWLDSFSMIRFNPALGQVAIGHIAPTLLVGLGWFQLIGLMLVAPILTSASISEEHVRRTLGILLTTPIQPLQIVMGKLVGPTIELLFLTALVVPVLAVVQIYGGITLTAVAATLALSLSSGILSATIAMALSTRSSKPHKVVLLTYVILALLFAGLPFMIGHAVSMRASFGPIGNELYAVSNPMISMVYLVIAINNPGAARLVAFPSVYWLAATCAFGMLGVSLLICLNTKRRVRQLASWESKSDQKKRQAPSLGQGTRNVETQTKIAEGVDVVGKIRASEAVSENPVLWRETRGRLTQRVSLVWILLPAGMAAGFACLIFAPYGLVYWDLMDAGAGGFHGLVTVMFLLFLLVQASVYSAPCLTSEKESSSWPLLLSTTLSGSTILWSKILGILLKLFPGLLILIVYVVLFATIGHLQPLLPLHTLLILMGFIPLAIAIGVLFSIKLRRTTTAVASSLSTFVTIWIIVPVGLSLSSWGAGSFALDSLYRRVLSLNPLILMLEASSVSARTGQLRNPYANYATDSLQGGFGGFTADLFFSCFVALFVAFFLLQFTISRFDSLTGRAS